MMPSGVPVPLSTRFDEQKLHAAQLQGAFDAHQTRFNALGDEVSLAKARVALAPEMAELLTFLQQQAHKRAVGVFEDLLSALLAEVFPEAGSVALTPGTERGVPALDIHLSKHGSLENILEGNGGAVTNILTTGLIFAARSRTNTRSLVTLDEPDCWMKDPAQVKPFLQVIADVADRTNCQTLLISHASPAYLPDNIHLIRLQDEGGHPAAVSVSGYRGWGDDAEEGVRWLEVENVRHHKLTRVYLCPGMNAFIGAHNLGKSTLVVSALRALALGDADDTLISHHQPFARVRVALENHVELEMVRKRTGTPKMLYRKYVRGTLVNEESPRVRGEVPVFIKEAMRIDYVDDLDIHLRSQKKTIFLLDEGPARRAKLLSIGRESGLLHDLAEKQRLTLRQDRELIRRGEEELTELQRKLNAMAPLSGVPTLVEIAQSLRDDVLAGSKVVEALRPAVAHMSMLKGKVQVLQPVSAVKMPPLPVLHDVAAGQRLVQQILKGACAQQVGLVPPAPQAPVLTDTRALQAAIAQLTKHAVGGRAVPVPETPAVPKLFDTAKLAALIAKLQQQPVTDQLPVDPAVTALNDTSKLRAYLSSMQGLLEQGLALKASLKDAELRLTQANEAYNQAKIEVGVCPLCSSDLECAHG